MKADGQLDVLFSSFLKLSKLSTPQAINCLYFLHFIQEVKIFTPDYTNIDPDAAIEDFKERIKHYEEVYEPLSDEKDAEGLCIISFAI